MSTKLTKHQHQAQMTQLHAMAEQLRSQRDGAIALLESHPNLDSFAYGEMLNHLHDAISECENVIASAEDEWATRKWTAADWASYELATQNID